MLNQRNDSEIVRNFRDELKRVRDELAQQKAEMAQQKAEIAQQKAEITSLKDRIEQLTNQVFDLNKDMDRIHLSILINDFKSKLHVEYLPTLQDIHQNPCLSRITQTDLNQFKDVKFNRKLVSIFEKKKKITN